MQLDFTSHAIAETLNVPAGLDSHFSAVSIDSRKVYSPEQTLFIALKGQRTDGHKFIGTLYNQGVRGFVVEQEPNKEDFPKAIFFRVKNAVQALQKIATAHRNKFDLPVIAITGSNGKTTVKEWLYEILNKDFNIVRSPKSYNSQIGVPLSVLEIEKHHTLGIFEAGISQPDEMSVLEKIIQPNYGVMVSLGSAHLKNFQDQEHLRTEKAQLFTSVQRLVCPEKIHMTAPEVLTFGSGGGVSWEEKADSIMFQSPEGEFDIPLKPEVLADNVACCMVVCHMLHLSIEKHLDAIKSLSSLALRLETIRGINKNTIIVDAYNNDLHGLEIALQKMNNFHHNQSKMIVLSEIEQDHDNLNQRYEKAAELIAHYAPDSLIGIGDQTKIMKQFLPEKIQTQFFPSIHDIEWHNIQDYTILLKGARKFHFESIIPVLEQRRHEAALYIDLEAIRQNIVDIRSKLNPDTALMTMVKAGAYGGGLADLSLFFEQENMDYLGVAYANEGKILRESDVLLPIVVMNAAESDFEYIFKYDLEPSIHNFQQLDQFIKACIRRKIEHFPIHIDIETGMHRLGFDKNEWQKLVALLKTQPEVQVKSVFSHLAAAGSQDEKVFTQEQIASFEAGVTFFEQNLSYSFKKHLLNSDGLWHYNQAQYDMVRCGIGLFGLSSVKGKSTLKLTAKISSIKNINQGESVGYNRSFKAKHDTTIAVVPIGYADGLPRALGNNCGAFNDSKNTYPIIGDVCMDMCMVDISENPNLKIGDRINLFSSNEEIRTMANLLNTIPYEIITGFSNRIRRILVD